VEVAQYQKVPICLRGLLRHPPPFWPWPFWHVEHPRLGLAVLFIAIIFASILLHELAHLEMPRRYRVRAQRIDIHMLGGLVQFWHLPHTRRQDFAITLAGPASNLAIGLVALALLAIVSRSAPDMIRIGDEFVPGPSAHGFFERLVQA
jgi:Zn-dependent protease